MCPLLEPLGHFLYTLMEQRKYTLLKSIFFFKLMARRPYICLKNILVYSGDFSPAPVAVKQSLFHHPSSTMYSWNEDCSDFTKHGTVHNDQTSLHLGLIIPKDIATEYLWLVQMQFCNPKLCYHIIFGENGLFP